MENRTESPRRVLAAAAWLAYVGSVLLANLLVTHYGVVDVVPGPWTLMAPAAVYAVGLALVARDVVHEAAGGAWRVWVFSGIAVGAVLSLFVASGNHKVVVASAVAFAASETIDLAVYLAARPWGWTWAAWWSSALSLFADSLIFLAIAFGGLAFFWGQVVGKLVVVAGTVALVGVGRYLGRVEVERALGVPYEMSLEFVDGRPVGASPVE